MNRPETIVRQILAGRGILADEAAAEYLTDQPKETHDPFLLPDMEAGVDLLFAALKGGRRICVYGDYDADGLTATALLVRFLRAAAARLAGAGGAGVAAADASAANADAGQGVPGAVIDYYIPSRFEEGYGLNADAVRTIAAAGTELLITVDCGSVSPAETALARELGMDTLVTDHHDCNAENLFGGLVINPKRPDSAYPFPLLSGCGVAFKLAQALLKRHFPGDEGLRAVQNSMLDLVAIATVADVVPLTGENRTLVKYGLKAIRAGKRRALARLVQAIGLAQAEVSAYNIAFGIAPHINASGRLAEARPVVELLLTDDVARMDAISKELVVKNLARREIQEELYARCVEEIDAGPRTDLFLLMHPAGVHEGIAGIVAGKLKSRYHRPAAVLAETEGSEAADGAAGTGGGLLKGSCRSIAGVDIIAMLRRHGALFTRLGGHPMAAGFTLPAENETALREALNAEMQAAVAADPSILEPDEKPEWTLAPGEATLELAALLEAFEPTGAANPKPLFELPNAEVTAFSRMGKDGKHARFTARQTGVPCVAFSVDELAPGLEDGTRVTLWGHLEIDRFRGKENLQFLVRRIL
ncbi:MAG: DHH family phosphoesterase [Clostridiales Family XIII bacterium]|jgi:single-stranded-DNA-specific exonuclease|nr:DHH family phosphoesterase [Clostridiales Family XIII bacterium]